MIRARLIGIAALFCAGVLAQAPGSMQAQLQRAEASSAPLWWGYRVSGTGAWNCGTVYLDGRSSKPQPGPVRVLLHIENHQVTRVRAVGGQCAIDAGSEPLQWASGADAAQSEQLLAGLAQQQIQGAIGALAETGGPGTVPAMIRLAKLNPSPRVREQAIFWLSQMAGEKAVGAISSAVANDPDTRVKERAVFALSQLPNDQGVPLLIHLAKSNKNPVVRKRAMFWLGQSKDPRALAFIEQILLH